MKEVSVEISSTGISQLISCCITAISLHWHGISVGFKENISPLLGQKKTAYKNRKCSEQHAQEKQQ